jgi:hypothetical protein
MKMMQNPRKSTTSKSDLEGLQKLVVSCLTSELEESLASGQVNQATIRNALQMLRDNDIVAAEDIEAGFDRLASLLPKVDPDLIISATRRYS